MRTTIAAVFLLVACCVLPARAQSALQLQWELKGDEFADARDRGASRAVFTLRNNGTTPLPARGWAIYFNALLPRTPGSEKGGIVIEQVIGELFRMVPDASFKGLASGQLLEVLATDPGSTKDFTAWAKSTGNELVEQTVEGVTAFYLNAGDGHILFI